MSSLESQLQNACRQVQKAQLFIKERIEQGPDGTLRISKRPNGKPRYYHTYRNGEKRINKYIRKSDPLAKELAMKDYYKDLASVLNEEKKVLKMICEKYHPDEKYRVYDELSLERKELVTPLFSPVKERVKQWDLEEWIQGKQYPEGFRYETEAGHLVRSKTERTIANMLYSHRDVLSYRYEQEIVLTKTGITVHPDFTIMNRKTGRIFYWEHVGMLDKEDYANDYVRKMNAYILEGLFPADNFFLTFETDMVPENLRVEKKILEILLKG